MAEKNKVVSNINRVNQMDLEQNNAAISSDKALGKIILQAKNIDVFYDQFQAIKGVSMGIIENTVTALIGPSGCGKSTFLRLFNRMNDYIEKFSLKGEIIFDNKNIYAKNIDVEQLRKEIGMVFQKPNPFPKSIFENVAYGLRFKALKTNHLLQTALKQH